MNDAEFIMAVLRHRRVSIEEALSWSVSEQTKQHLRIDLAMCNAAIARRLGVAQSGPGIEPRGCPIPCACACADAAVAAMIRNCAAIVRAQPFYPDTHTGMRQQWVKDQIAAKIDALT